MQLPNKTHPDPTDHMGNLVFPMDSDDPDPQLWPPQSFADVQFSANEIDDIMKEAHHATATDNPNTTNTANIILPDPHAPPPPPPSSSLSTHHSLPTSKPLHSHSNAHTPQPRRTSPHLSAVETPTPLCRNPSHPPQAPHLSNLQSPRASAGLTSHQHHLYHRVASLHQVPMDELTATFSLPQTIAGTYPSKPEPNVHPVAPQYLESSRDDAPSMLHCPPYHSPQQVLPLHVADLRVVDRDVYVRRSAERAEDAKLMHRMQLKKDQRQKESDAKALGVPLTAKDKERERSRRESAVTRKRAEIYILELEQACRRLPEVEHRLRFVEAELVRTRRWMFGPERQAQLSQPQSQSQSQSQCQAQSQQQINSMMAGLTRGHQDIKTEPTFTFSANSESTSTVLNQMQQLDLRLPNTGTSGP